MRTCVECGGAIPRTRHPLTTVCSEACHKERHLRHSRESYKRNSASILEKRKDYQQAWREENPTYNAEWRRENQEKAQEYNRKMTYAWQLERPELTERVSRILSRCSPERAERLCLRILESNSERWRRFRSSYSGDDLLADHLGF